MALHAALRARGCEKSATPGLGPERRSVAVTAMSYKHTSDYNDTDCDDAQLTDERAAEMLETIADREQWALTVVDEALLGCVADSLRDDDLPSHMLPEQLDTIVQNNEDLSRDSQQVIAGVRDCLDDGARSDGGEPIPTATRVPDEVAGDLDGE